MFFFFFFFHGFSSYLSIDSPTLRSTSGLRRKAEVFWMASSCRSSILLTVGEIDLKIHSKSTFSFEIQ